MSRLAHPAGPRHADVLPAEHAPIPPDDLNALDPAIWPRSARRAGGALTIGGIDVRDLAAQYGTPAFVLDEEDFRGRCRDFAQAFGERAAVFYAAKAFCCRGVLRWAAAEGLGVDVCTGGELEVALAAGVDPAMITMHGSNKLLSELERAVATGVGHVVVDSFEEIARLAFVTEERDDVAAHRVLELAARIRDEHGVHIEELNLGGGFSIAYTPDDDPADIKVIAQSLHQIVAAQCAAAGLEVPRLTVEPGRAIAGPGTVTLYEVGTIKDVDGLRSYVSVDGGMSDNIRTALYGAEYTCALASRESAAPPMLSRVVGRHCESGDIVVRDTYLPADLAPGDLVAVAATGAYCRSMASNYNHVLRPPVPPAGGGRQQPPPGPARPAGGPGTAPRAPSPAGNPRGFSHAGRGDAA